MTDEKGAFCTQILAHLGAEVIRIEKPGGDLTRSIGPFHHDTHHPEKSLHWFIFNAGKLGITLDIETKDGQVIFKTLVKGADFVVECFPPGYMEALGLGYSALREINPHLVMTSISGFGQTGPYRDYRSSDIVGLAMGGLMSVTGDPDRPPVRIGPSQAYLQAGAQAAVGTMIAHHYRQATGEGQQVDVSIQESVTYALDRVPQWWQLRGTIISRPGAFFDWRDNLVERLVFPCQDGYVATQTLHPIAYQRLIQWLDSEGMAGDLTDDKWLGRSGVYQPSRFTQEEVDHLQAIMANFFKTRTKAQIHAAGQRWRVNIGPVNTPEDLLENPQLAARDFFVEVEHPELGTLIAYPGPPFKMSETPWKVSRRAPLLGEHNNEVYQGELGFSREELAWLKQARVI